MNEKFTYLECGFGQRFFMGLVLCICLGVLGIAGCDNGKKASSFIGSWKLEKLMPHPGQEWLEAKYPFIMRLLPNGTLEILLRAPDQTIRITGTWKILADGRLQISQEGQDGETYEKPATIIFNRENGRLIAAARPYVNETEKEQAGFIFKKEGQ
jgi:hypothetical protein